MSQEIKKETPWKIFLSLTFLFLIWRVCLWLLAFLGKHRLFLIHDLFLERPGTPDWIQKLPYFLQYWTRWDSGWYRSICERGYFWDGPGKFSNVVFFPLYPLLMKYLGSFFSDNFILAGVIISSLACLLVCFYLYHLARLDLSKDGSFRSVFYLLIFPTAIFLSAVYTESLFLLCAIACFYHARKQEWFLASIWGFGASLTRLIGVVLFIALLIEYFEQRNFSFKKIKLDLLSLAFIPLGLGLYMYYLYEKFGNPWLFIHSQKAWNRAISLPNLGRNLIRYFHDLFFPQTKRMAYYFVNNFDLLVFLLFLILAIGCFIWLRKSYGVYAFLGLIIPSLSGTLTSMGRYALILFPIFILLARLGKNKIINFAIILIFLSLMAVFTVMFVNTYWVG